MDIFNEDIFNEPLIKNTPTKKVRPFFVFMEEVHMPQSQVLLREGRTFLYKALNKLYRNSKLNFLVNFNLISSALQNPKESQS